MKLEKVDYFQPFIVVVAIIAFLLMGYIGSFNYRFEDPLDAEVILTVVFACIVFAVIPSILPSFPERALISSADALIITEITLIPGGQPVYYYIISVE